MAGRVPGALILACACLVHCAEARADTEIRLADPGPWHVTPNLEYAWESTPGERPADNAFTSIGRDSAAFGLISGTYWFRLRIQNATDEPHLTLVLENPRLGLVELWRDGDTGLVRVARVGDVEAPTSGVLGRRPPAFNLEIAPGASETVYLRVNHLGSLQFRAWVWPEREFLQHRSFQNVIDGALCGAIAVMFLYNALITIHVRRLSYLYFTLCVLFYLLFTLSLQGLGNDYVWTGHAWLATRGIIFFCGWGSFFVHAFSRAYLSTQRRAPVWDTCLVAGLVLSAIVGFGSLTYSLVFSYLAHFLVIVTPIYVIGASLACWRAGYRPAGVFFLAWSVLLVCGGALSMVSLGWIPKNWYAEGVVQAGVVIALTLFSVALDARARISAQRFRMRLEREVAERTAELQIALDNVRTLSGIVPICSHCKKIRDDAGYWNQVEAYLARLGDVSLSHGVCPECAVKHYPELGPRDL